MKELELTNEKLKLEYPCNWVYKIITQNRDAAREAVEDLIKDKEHKLVPSKNSKTGKYCSMNLELVVESEEARNEIYTALKANPDILMVL